MWKQSADHISLLKRKDGCQMEKTYMHVPPGRGNLHKEGLLF